MSTDLRQQMHEAADNPPPDASSWDDPEEAKRAAEALTGAVEEADDDEIKVDLPDLPEPRDTTVELPVGLPSPTGLETTAEVRELTGMDEEYLAKKSVRKNMYTLIQGILERGVTQIGSEKPTPDMLENLLIGDRETLLLAIRKATYGTEIELTFTCPNCNDEQELLYDIDKDIPRREFDNEQLVFEVEIRGGRTVELTLPTGAVQKELFARSDSTVAELNTLMLSRTVQAIDGTPVLGSPEPVKRLGMQDRSKLLDFLDEKQPGPRMEEVSYDCAKCGRTAPIVLSVFDLFRL